MRRLKSKFDLKFLNIELTNRCQLNCKWCSDKKTRKRGDMPLTGVYNVLTQAWREFHKLCEVRLFCSGEPLLYPKLVEAIQLVTFYGHAVSIHSNGVALTKEKADELVEVSLMNPRMVSMSFSVDGRNEKEYEENRGPHLKTVLKNLKYFIEKNEHMGCPIKIQVQTLVPYLAELKKPDFIPLYPNVKYFVRWPHDWDQKGSIPEADCEEIYDPPCGFLQDSLVVYWNGDCPICCADLNGERLIGNIFKDGIQYIKQCINTARYYQENNLPCAICKGCGRYEVKDSDN